jgi:hypothetical protein
MRNRTIRSVLARRPMFANGGMLPPVTQNPMAAGILASSSPLVETVNNQQSPNQGVRVSMKDGGIAKFQNGGFTSFPSQTIAPDTSERIASYLSGYGLGRQPFKLVSEEAINIMDPNLRKKRERIFPGFRAAGGEGDPPGGRLQRSFYNLAKGAQAATSAAYGAAESGLRYLLSPTAEEKGYSVSQQTTIDKLIKNRPELEDTIISSADDAIKVAKSAWDEYQLLPVKEKNSEKGTNLLRQYGITPTDPTISGDNLANQIALGVSMKLENLESLLDSDLSSEDVSETEIQALFREGPPGESGPSSVPGVSDVEELVESSENVSGLAEGLAEGPPDDPESFESAEKKETTAEKIRKQVTQEPGLTNEEREILADLRPERKPPIEGKDTPETAAQQLKKIINKPDMSEKEATKTIADYKKDFIDQMPEYEGMSEEEKGFALMEAGLRVAAGESPNAITNIAKGLKGIGDTFAKDKKEKRAWDRQVELSAVKYGMVQFNKDKEDTRKLETTTEKLIATGKGSFTLPNGEVVNYNEDEIVFVPKSVILNKGVPSNLLDPTLRGIQITASAARAKAAGAAQKAIREELIVKDKDSRETKKLFLKYADKTILGYEVKALIENSFDISDQAVGFTNVGKNLIFKGLSATGWKPEFLAGPGTDAEKSARIVERLGGREKYNQQMQEVANRLLKRLLGEGSKNVSNVDRDLAQQISGLVKDTATGVTSNPTLLRQRLKRILDMANKDIRTGETEMQTLYSEMSSRISPGMSISGIGQGGSYAERVLAPLAQQSLLERRGATRTTEQQKLFKKIPGFTFKSGKYVVDTK